MSDTDIALSRLAGITKILPKPDFTIGMYVRKEAMLSSQIEGIQYTSDEVLEAEVDDEGARTKDIAKVVNYADAMNLWDGETRDSTFIIAVNPRNSLAVNGWRSWRA